MNLYAAAFAFAMNLATKEPRFSQHVDEDVVDKVVRATIAVSVEVWQVETLLLIARGESGFDKDVVFCRRLNSYGARGTFQIVPRSNEEVADSCSQLLEKQAHLALVRIQESVDLCENAGIRGRDSLGIYTHGRCFVGNQFSRKRYGNGLVLRELMKEAESGECTRR